MPTTAPAIRTKTSTLVIPFLRSAFSPKKCPALNRKPTKKMTPNKIGKILVSDYLYFTQPEALERISKLKNIETRLHVRGNFHGKGYLFRMGDRYDLLIGSSNLTATALSTNKELNLHVSGSENGQLIKNFRSFFEEAFNNAKQITEEELHQL